MRKIIYIAIALFVVACASKKTETNTSTGTSNSASSPVASSFLPAAKAVSADNFKSSIPNFTFDSFVKGKMLYETKCNKCHPPKEISSQTVEGWNHEVPDMVKKHNKKFEDQIDEQSQSMILGYVLTSLEMGVK